jgi:chemotaxis regulatin CheY-phosphate phosphatase CheZ
MICLVATLLAATYLDAKMIGCAESLEEMARMVVMGVMVVTDAMDAVGREAPRAAKVPKDQRALRDRWVLKDRLVL